MKLKIDKLEPDRYEYLSKKDSVLYAKLIADFFSRDELRAIALRLIEDKAEACRQEHKNSTY